MLSNKHLTVERASCCLTSILLWNGHLAVERASCCGTGILLWNGHLARYNSRAGRIPTPLIFLRRFSNASTIGLIRNLVNSQLIVKSFHQ
ncbi:hypothetical protein [Moorena producens]|uniref:hypothetical protein n=1 Tax=Moorena producens TaxID=1155739 RepID=UPI003C71E0B0